MQNRTLKGIQEIELLFKLASKYDLDSQTRQAKLQHIQEKFSDLKKMREEESIKQKKELKVKNKQIQKLRQRQRNLLEGMGQSQCGSPHIQEKAGNRMPKNSATVKLNSTMANQKQMIEKQIEKKIKAQEKLRELKYKLEKLQAELLKYQKQNQALRSQNQRLNEENYSQKLMIQAFLKQQEYESSQNQSQNSGQICENTNQDQLDEQFSQTPQKRKVFKMMNLEGQRIQLKKKDSQVYEQDEILKYIDQIQTDDEQELKNQVESIHNESSDSDNHDLQIKNYDQYKQEKITRKKLLKQKESESQDKVDAKFQNNEENKIEHEQEQKLFRMKKQRWFTWWLKWW